MKVVVELVMRIKVIGCEDIVIGTTGDVSCLVSHRRSEHLNQLIFTPCLYQPKALISVSKCQSVLMPVWLPWRKEGLHVVCHGV